MTLVKVLGFAAMFVVGLLAAAVSALMATSAVWGDVGVVVFFVLFIAPPLSAVLSLFIAFKLLPRDGCPRPVAFVISSAVLGALPWTLRDPGHGLDHLTPSRCDCAWR